MIVIDAGVLVVALLDHGAAGSAIRARLRGYEMASPELVDLECASVIRRFVRNGDVTADRGSLALEDLHSLAINRTSHSPLISRCWELRDNMSMYDASYVALAEAIEAPLWTTDARLARSPGTSCRFELIST
ncbi:type II toxin-antitoxin system VapC family toxin [Actinomycetes bacterium M1A6_2h]